MGSPKGLNGAAQLADTLGGAPSCSTRNIWMPLPEPRSFVGRSWTVHSIWNDVADSLMYSICTKLVSVSAPDLAKRL